MTISRRTQYALLIAKQTCHSCLHLQGVNGGPLAVARHHLSRSLGGSAPTHGLVISLMNRVHLIHAIPSSCPDDVRTGGVVFTTPAMELNMAILPNDGENIDT